MSQLQVPQPDKKDVLYKTVQAALALLARDVLGLFSIIMAPPLEKRQEEWQIEVVQTLAEVSEKLDSLTIENLSNNPVFITAVTNVTPIVIRTHQREKLEALRNVVVNAALPNPPDDDTQTMFFEMLNTFTSWHLKLLKFFGQDNWFVLLGYSETLSYLDPAEILQRLVAHYSNLQGNETFANKIVTDLNYNRLISLPDAPLALQNEIWTSEEPISEVITDLGRSFLKFTSSPLDR